MKRLTRKEIWEAICSKCPEMKVFTIESTYTNNITYINREHLLRLLYILRVDKSRHLTKEQKKRLKYEQELKFIEKL